jgi:alanyl-tRNA synthetase
VTGRKAYSLIKKRFNTIDAISDLLETSANSVEDIVKNILHQKAILEGELRSLREKEAIARYQTEKQNAEAVDDIVLLPLFFEGIPISILRQLADIFRNDFEKGLAIFGSLVEEGKVQFVVTASDYVVKTGVHAGEIAKSIAKEIGGSGGGRPNLAQAGGNDYDKLLKVKLSEYVKKLG